MKWINARPILTEIAVYMENVNYRTSSSKRSVILYYTFCARVGSQSQWQFCFYATKCNLMEKMADSQTRARVNNRQNKKEKDEQHRKYDCAGNFFKGQVRNYRSSRFHIVFLQKSYLKLAN